CARTAEPLAAPSPARESFGPKTTSRSAAAITTASTSRAGTWCARVEHRVLGRRPFSDDVVADRQKFEIGNRPRHAKAGRVHAPADREQCVARAGGLRAVQPLRAAAHIGCEG